MAQTQNTVSDRNTLRILRISIGIIYLWFGMLKFFPGYSPAEALAAKTVSKLTFGWMGTETELLLLASWECLIGILLLTGRYRKQALCLLFIHMACTFTPMIFFPRDTFNYLPYGLSLTGQYIVKNAVIVSSAIVLWQAEKNKSSYRQAKPEESGAAKPDGDLTLLIDNGHIRVQGNSSVKQY